MSKLTKAGLLVLIVLIADQVLKIWIKTTFHLGQELPIFGDYVKLLFTENNGMAFGMEFGGEAGKLFLSIFRIIAIFGIGWYLTGITKKGAPLGVVLSVSLIIAGALGNVIDSAFYGIIFSESYFTSAATFMPEGGGYASFLHGRVVDMFYFPLIKGNFPAWVPFWGGSDFIFFRPIFNIADSAISIGVVIILIFYRKFFSELDEKKDSDKSLEEEEIIPATEIKTEQ
ncbi:MAG TPA: lipoprotein signal peptidase [Bacteroidales bacterium]|nr:lipoprotein signal peptidase [Bacteroidales bacterium]